MLTPHGPGQARSEEEGPVAEYQGNTEQAAWEAGLMSKANVRTGAADAYEVRAFRSQICPMLTKNGPIRCGRAFMPSCPCVWPAQEAKRRGQAKDYDMVFDDLQEWFVMHETNPGDGHDPHDDVRVCVCVCVCAGMCVCVCVNVCERADVGVTARFTRV